MEAKSLQYSLSKIEDMLKLTIVALNKILEKDSLDLNLEAQSLIMNPKLLRTMGRVCW